MSVIFVLIPLSILVAAGFLAAFIWAVRSGQYEDTCTPPMRLLMDDRGRGEQRTRPLPSAHPSPRREGEILDRPSENRTGSEDSGRSARSIHPHSKQT